MPKMEMNPTPADTLNGVPVDDQRKDSPRQAIGICAMMIKVSIRDCRRGVEHAGNQQQRERHNDHQASIGRLEFTVLARPLQMTPSAEFHLPRYAMPGILDGALQVPIPTVNLTGT